MESYFSETISFLFPPVFPTFCDILSGTQCLPVSKIKVKKTFNHNTKIIRSEKYGLRSCFGKRLEECVCLCRFECEYVCVPVWI